MILNYDSERNDISDKFKVFSCYIFIVSIALIDLRVKVDHESSMVGKSLYWRKCKKKIIQILSVVRVCWVQFANVISAASEDNCLLESSARRVVRSKAWDCPDSGCYIVRFLINSKWQSFCKLMKWSCVSSPFLLITSPF